MSVIRGVFERQRTDAQKAAVMAVILQDAIKALPGLEPLDVMCVKPHEVSRLMQDAKGNQYVVAVRPIG